jgi:membrane fusion protein, multidrug efflux system
MKAIIPLLFLLTPFLQAQEKPSVRTTLPTAATVANTYELPGRTEPLESALIFTRATGIVRERKFDIGDQVKAGDVLATIDAPEIDREVEAARAAVDQAAARYKTARQAADRSATLRNTRALSQDETEQRISEADESEAALRMAEAELDRLEELQKFATVLAPFDAVISARNFDRGDRMRGDSSTAEGWLYRLVRLDTLRFVISATPDLALRLSNETQTTVRFTELPGRTYTAKLSRTAKVLDTTSGTMRAEFLIENKDLKLPAGFTGLAAFSLSPMPGTFTLPTNTLLVRQGKTMVAIALDGKVSFIEVLPGKNFGATLEVTSAALSADTPVIINPNGMLKPGDSVEIAAAAATK